MEPPARAVRPKNMKRFVGAVVAPALLISFAACQGDAPKVAVDPESGTTMRDDPPTYQWSDEPSPVVLLLSDRDVQLRPWTSCWSGPPDPDGTAAGICADGAPPDFDHLQSAGENSPIEFWFGLPGWEFEGSISLGPEQPEEGRCTAPLPVETTGEQTFAIAPSAAPGDYQVDLFGRGEQGDVMVSFRWTSTDADAAPVECP